MRPLDSARRRLVMALGLPVAAAGCASRIAFMAPPSSQPPPPTVRSGERWRYALINRYNGERTGEVLAEVVAVQPELRVRLTDATGTALGEERYREPWEILQEPLFGAPVVFAEPLTLVPPSLAVDVRLEQATRYRLADFPTRRRWSSRLHALGWERVQVPAGSFDALRIERISYFDHHDAFRFASRREETLWYAPSVNRWVQRDWTGYYRAESSLSDRRGTPEDREDAVRWVLLAHDPAPVSHSG
ncbi:MAG: hypothetical protein R3E68_20790 [Burkholderiaceae bacterium]